MPVNSVRRLLLFFTVYYFAQGIYNAYNTFEQPFLKSRDIGLSDVSTAKSVAIIPWSIKILFALPTDYLGRRKPFIFVGMLMGASLLASITQFDPKESYPAYVATVFFRNFGIAISDVAVDGMSVDVALDHMSGTIQGFMSLGRVSGTLLGSAIGGPIAKKSYEGVIWFLAAIIFAVVPVVFLVKEEKGQAGNKSKAASSSGVGDDAPVADDEFEWAAFKELLKPSIICFLLYAMIGNLSAALSNIPGVEWSQTVVNLDAEQLGYLATVSSLGDLIGALSMGFIFDRIDKRIGMMATAIVSSVANVASIWCVTVDAWFAQTFFAGVAAGALFVCNCGMVMRLADKRLGASVFAIAVSLMNFSIMIGNAIGGPLAEATDLENCFWFAFGVNLIQLPLVPFIVETQKVSNGSGGIKKHESEKRLAWPDSDDASPADTPSSSYANKAGLGGDEDGGDPSQPEWARGRPGASYIGNGGGSSGSGYDAHKRSNNLGNAIGDDDRTVVVHNVLRQHQHVSQPSSASQIAGTGAPSRAGPAAGNPFGEAAERAIGAPSGTGNASMVSSAADPQAGGGGDGGSQGLARAINSLARGDAVPMALPPGHVDKSLAARRLAQLQLQTLQQQQHQQQSATVSMYATAAAPPSAAPVVTVTAGQLAPPTQTISITTTVGQRPAASTPLAPIGNPFAAVANGSSATALPVAPPPAPQLFASGGAAAALARSGAGVAAVQLQAAVGGKPFGVPGALQPTAPTTHAALTSPTNQTSQYANAPLASQDIGAALHVSAGGAGNSNSGIGVTAAPPPTAATAPIAMPVSAGNPFAPSTAAAINVSSSFSSRSGRLDLSPVPVSNPPAPLLAAAVASNPTTVSAPSAVAGAAVDSAGGHGGNPFATAAAETAAAGRANRVAAMRPAHVNAP